MKTSLFRWRFIALAFLAIIILALPFGQIVFAQGQQVISLARDVKPTSLTLGKGEFTVTLTLTANSTACPPGPVRVSPLDIVLILDHSGSMDDFLGTFLGSGSKMDNAKKAAKTFLANVNLGTDQVAIVQFDASADVVQSLTTNRQTLEQRIDSIRPADGTTIESGVDAARKELDSSRHNQGSDRVMVLLTDGQNEDGSDDQLLASADSAKAAGIRVITIGLGSDVNENLLRRLASQSSDYYFAPDAGQLSKIYETIAKSIKKPIAATNLTLRHSVDTSAFQIVPGSVAPSGVLGSSDITWSLPSVSDGALTFTYRVTPRSAGRFNVDAGDQVTFTQCEATPGEITQQPGLAVVVSTPPPPSPTPTPTATPTPRPTFTPAPAVTVTQPPTSPLNSICDASASWPLWIPCLLLPLLIFAIWFTRKIMKELERRNKKPEARGSCPCPLILWLLIPFLLILLWLVVSQLLNNVCLGRDSVYFWRINPDSSSGIFVTNPNGTRSARPFTQVNQASQCVGCHAISNASHRIALVQDGGVGPVAVFGLDGKPVSIPDFNGSYLAWSPDGSKLAISNENHVIVILDVDSGTITPLAGASDPNYSQVMPAWSPDGNAIAFVRSAGIGTYRLDQPTDIYVANLIDHSVIPLVGASGSGFNYYPAYSPDGKWIAFTHHTTGRTTYSDPNAEIFVVPATGGVAKRLAANDAPDGRKLTGVGNSWPSWSRDGASLAFTSKRNNKQWDIFVTQVFTDGTSGPAIPLASAADPNAKEMLSFWGEPPQIDPFAGLLDLWPWLIPLLVIFLLYLLCKFLCKPTVVERPPRGARVKPELLEFFLENTWQVAPTLIIGVGGTGRWVLTHLKKNLKDSGMGTLPEKVRFVLLDTSEREEANILRDATGKPLRVEFAGEALESSEIMLLRGNLGQLVRAAAENAKDTEPYKGWFPASRYREVGSGQLDLANGTQGRRPLARAGLIKGLLEADPQSQTGLMLWKMLTVACREVLDEDHVRVILVGSVAGGMSGIVFDLAHLARLAGGKAVSKDGTVSVEAYLAGASTFNYAGGNAVQRQVDSYAAMRELQRFQLSKGLPYHIQYRATGTQPLDSVTDTQLFDDVFLFGEGGQPESGQGKSTEPWATIFASIADVICFRIDRGVKAGTNLDYRGDAQKRLSDLQTEKTIAVVGSAGTFVYRLPLRDIVEQIRVRWARALLHEFMQGTGVTKGDPHQIAETQVDEFLAGQLGSKKRPDGLSVVQKLASGLTMRFNRGEVAQVPDASVGIQQFQEYLSGALNTLLNGEEGQSARVDRIDQAKEFLESLTARLLEVERSATDAIQISKPEIAAGLERAKKLAELWRVHVEKIRDHIQLQHDVLAGRSKTAKQSEFIGVYQRLGVRDMTVKSYRAQMDKVGVREYLWWRVKDTNAPLTDPKNQIDLATEWYDKKADPEIGKFLPRFYWKFASAGEPQLGLVSFKGSDIALSEATIDQFVEELLKMGAFVVQDIWKEIRLPEVMRGRHVVGSEKYVVETATRMWGTATPHLRLQHREAKWGAALGVPNSLQRAAPEYVKVFEVMGGMDQKIASAMNTTRAVIAELTDQYATGLIRTVDFVPISEIPEMKQARSRYEQSLTSTITGVEGAVLQTAFAAERYALDYEKRLPDSQLYRLPMRQLHPLVVMALEQIDRAKLFALAFAAGWIKTDPNKTTATLEVPGNPSEVLARKGGKQLDLRIAALLSFCQSADQKIVNIVQYNAENPPDATIAQWRKYYSEWKNWQGAVPMAQEPQEVQDLGAIAALEVYDRLQILRGR